MAKAESLERDYNVPLRRGYLLVPRHKRAQKAIKTLREFMAKHMKSDDILIGQHLNEHVWSRGMRNPPHHVKVHAVKDPEGVVKVELHGKKFKEAVRPAEIEEPQGLKEKLMSKVGGKKEADEKPAEAEKKPKPENKKPLEEKVSPEKQEEKR